MTASPERWVPKVHPLTRQAEPEDPLELVASPVGGDPEVMLECILQEFAWMGWGEEQLLGLFRSPAYPVLNGLRAHFGDEEVARRVRGLVARWGALRFRETVVEGLEEDDDEPELLQVSVARVARGG